MVDVFQSCKILVENQNFFSFSILCRSVLDMTVQLMWILDIESTEKRQEAIELFLNFDGIGEYDNGKGEKKKTYQWQDIIIKDRFNYHQVIKRLGLDCENKYVISTFGYLSKVVHWNPKIINSLVGFTNENLVFGSKKLDMFFIASSEFVRCSLSFLIIFAQHFYPKEFDAYLKEVEEVQRAFFSALNDVASKISIP